MKPRLRQLPELELRSSLYLLIRRVLEDKPYPFVSCLSCTNFIKATEICKLANQRPPAEILCHGCPQYDDAEDLIPF